MSISTQASSGTTGSAGADTQALRESARRADKSGSSGAGSSVPTKRRPSTQKTVSKTSPKSKAPTVSAKSGSTARHSARPSEILLVESVWVDVGGILNPDHLSAKSAAASKRKVRSRPGNGHDNPFQCFNKHETLEKEGIEFEATCSQFSS